MVDKINVYDFDNTLYDGESTLDFYLFCVKKHPRLCRFIFIVVFTLVKYKLCLVSEEKLMSLCEKYVMDFLFDCPDANELVELFWQKNSKKLRRFYGEVKKDDDAVVSASFGFLLRPVIEQMGINNLLCSEVDLTSGKILRLCFRKNKEKLFREFFADKTIDDFYTDSMNDLPLMKLAKGSVYLVKGEKANLYKLHPERRENQ